MNSFDLPVAIVAVSYSTVKNDAIKRGLIPDLVASALKVGGGAMLVGLAGLGWLGRRQERAERRSTWVIVLLTLVALVAVSVDSIGAVRAFALAQAGGKCPADRAGV